jgi:hypothetical protein
VKIDRTENIAGRLGRRVGALALTRSIVFSGIDANNDSTIVSNEARVAASKGRRAGSQVNAML